MKRGLSIKIIWILAFFSFGLPNGLCAAQEQKVTLSQALKAAFRHNPSIEASQHQVAALESMVDQATAAYLPQLTNTTNYYRVGGDLPDMIGGLFRSLPRQSGATGFPDPNSPMNIYNTNFFVSQHLYDFGKTSGNLENKEQHLAAGRKDLDKSVADVVCNVKEAYFEMLKKIRLTRVAKESLSTYEKNHEQAKPYSRRAFAPESM